MANQNSSEITIKRENKSSINAMSREITKEELAQHNKQTDAWMAIRGKVYDVTDFLRKHPGGKSSIMQGIGKDATGMFNQAHNYVDPDRAIPGKQVGVLKR
ncbi:Cytochrome b5 reductase 4 [Orchesella cincta]|uniref:Cytochrome b5 reductase 4 n=1 Tax=Orchesella cincta TaxID=48709 RepID=A0A1D2MB99_ORCCI|nr:Cytochrome b5 reductase 4 [Orchesella cincta]